LWQQFDALPNNTLDRVKALNDTRQALLQWAIAVPGQHDPVVRRQVDAEIQRIRDADEATVERMAEAIGLPPYRERARKIAPTEFYARRQAMRQDFFDKNERWPTATEEADYLNISRKTLSRYLHPKPTPKKKRRKS
jgi:hypothetical protein